MSALVGARVGAVALVPGVVAIRREPLLAAPAAVHRGRGHGMSPRLRGVTTPGRKVAIGRRSRRVAGAARTSDGNRGTRQRQPRKARHGNGLQNVRVASEVEGRPHCPQTCRPPPTPASQRARARGSADAYLKSLPAGHGIPCDCLHRDVGTALDAGHNALRGAH